MGNQCPVSETAIGGWEVPNPFIGISGLDITENDLHHLFLIFSPLHSHLPRLVETLLLIINKHMSRW
jgi:hypothetical protein